jgi:hypothetical protein
VTAERKGGEKGSAVAECGLAFLSSIEKRGCHAPCWGQIPSRSLATRAGKEARLDDVPKVLLPISRNVQESSLVRLLLRRHHPLQPSRDLDAAAQLTKTTVGQAACSNRSRHLDVGAFPRGVLVVTTCIGASS